ncbi:MBL fold metallo-hydrolase [Candidatus Wolfebacteria bacterium]|nr:MBL fold metallo-hydrolase [Candidatus Wolfebacteria bacterium]
MPDKNRLFLAAIFLVIFNVLIWNFVVFGAANDNFEIYFLDVGQGDSQLVILPGGVKTLIDGGPDNRILKELSSLLPFNRYIDLVILTHAQKDHFSGLIDVLKRYKVGVFIFNGRPGTTADFKDLGKAVEESGAKIVVFGEKDKIKYRENYFYVFSPSRSLLSGKEINDSSLVIKLVSGGIGALFTGDMTLAAENYIIEKYGSDLDVDILKVGHHGSKYASSENFLKIVSPKISVIEVGKNSYGHPTIEALNRLTAAGSKIFRTDKDGTVKLVIKNQKISVFKKK